MGRLNNDNFQENLSRFTELGDSIHGNSMEEMEQRLNEMESVFQQHAGEWEIMVKFQIEKMADGMCKLGQKYYKSERYWDALFWCRQAGVS